MVKNPPVSAGDTGSISGLEDSPGGGNGNPPQDSCLGNSMDKAGWQAPELVAKSWTGLSAQVCLWTV